MNDLLETAHRPAARRARATSAAIRSSTTSSSSTASTPSGRGRAASSPRSPRRSRTRCAPGKLPIQAISGTMGIMDGAAKVMKGLAAAGQAVVDEAVKAAEHGDDARAADAAGRAPEAGVEYRQLISRIPPTIQAGSWPFLPGTGEHHDHSPLGVHPGHRPAGGDLARRRLDDRLGDLHRLRRHRPPGVGLGTRRAARRLDRHRRHDGRPGALAYAELAAMMPKAGGQYVFLREGLQPAGRLPLRVDAVRGHPDRHDRGGGGGVRQIPGRARARRSAPRSSCPWASSGFPAPRKRFSSASRPSAWWRSP